MLFRSKMLWKIVWVGDAKARHFFLLFRGSWLASGKRIFEPWGRFRSDGGPFVEFLTEKISFFGQEDLGSFDFAEVEALGSDLFGCG